MVDRQNYILKCRNVDRDVLKMMLCASVGNETNKSAVFENFTFYFDQLVFPLLYTELLSRSGLSLLNILRSYSSQCLNYLSPYRENQPENQLILNNL